MQGGWRVRRLGWDKDTSVFQPCFLPLPPLPRACRHASGRCQWTTAFCPPSSTRTGRLSSGAVAFGCEVLPACGVMPSMCSSSKIPHYPHLCPPTHPPTACREDVDAINAQQLKDLPSEARRFLAQDAGSGDVLAAACPAKRTLDLKVSWLVGW